jgi:hypothetical protein
MQIENNSIELIEAGRKFIHDNRLIGSVEEKFQIIFGLLYLANFRKHP